MIYRGRAREPIGTLIQHAVYVLRRQPLGMAIDDLPGLFLSARFLLGASVVWPRAPGLFPPLNGAKTAPLTAR